MDCTTLINILRLIVNILFAKEISVLRAVYSCISKLREHILRRPVQNIIPRILKGSLDQCSGICGHNIPFGPMFNQSMWLHIYRN